MREVLRDQKIANITVRLARLEKEPIRNHFFYQESGQLGRAAD